MDERSRGGENRLKGLALEQQGGRYLSAHGLRMLGSNYHCRAGEIDLIMQDGDTLVFIEVRFRRSGLRGSPVETVTPAKQRKLIRCARHYLMSHRLQDAVPCRFDVLGIGPGNRMTWIRNAFSQLPV
ncbi:MAG: YraN family protein [Pseudohongiellaceae bacterium]